MLDSDVVSRISSQIYSKFPEVNGARPKVQSQGSGYLLIFKGSARSSSGAQISRVVRVVVSDTGKVIKTTTSK